MYVQLDDVPLDLKVYAEDLEAAFSSKYELKGHELRGGPNAPSFGLGDGVRLRVASHDPGRRRYAFDVERLKSDRS